MHEFLMNALGIVAIGTGEGKTLVALAFCRALSHSGYGVVTRPKVERPRPSLRVAAVACFWPPVAAIRAWRSTRLQNPTIRTRRGPKMSQGAISSAQNMKPMETAWNQPGSW